MTVQRIRDAAGYLIAAYFIFSLGATTASGYWKLPHLWAKAHVADTAAPTIGVLKKQAIVLNTQNVVLKKELVATRGQVTNSKTQPAQSVTPVPN